MKKLNPTIANNRFAGFWAGVANDAPILPVKGDGKRKNDRTEAKGTGNIERRAV